MLLELRTICFAGFQSHSFGSRTGEDVVSAEPSPENCQRRGKRRGSSTGEVLAIRKESTITDRVRNAADDEPDDKLIYETGNKEAVDGKFPDDEQDARGDRAYPQVASAPRRGSGTDGSNGEGRAHETTFGNRDGDNDGTAVNRTRHVNFGVGAFELEGDDGVGGLALPPIEEDITYELEVRGGYRKRRTRPDLGEQAVCTVPDGTRQAPLGTPTHARISFSCEVCSFCFMRGFLSILITL